MFGVKTDRMIDCCVQLERQAVELKQLNVEMDAVICSLSSESGLDNIVEGLKIQKAQVETEGNMLRWMMHGLDRIERDYISCENRICDNGEHCVIRFERRKVETSNLSRISSILEHISFY
jgi:hypothetical protein